MGSLCISYRINNVQYAAFSLYVPTPISLSPPHPHTHVRSGTWFISGENWLADIFELGAQKRRLKRKKKTMIAGPTDFRSGINKTSTFDQKIQVTKIEWGWSGGYGRRLLFERSWVWIPAMDTRWFFPHLFVVKLHWCSKIQKLKQKWPIFKIIDRLGSLYTDNDIKWSIPCFNWLYFRLYILLLTAV